MIGSGMGNHLFMVITSDGGHRHERQSSTFGLNKVGSFFNIGLVMQIIFPKQSAIDPDTMGVAFPVEVDGVRRRVLISTEALEDHFGGDHNPDKKSVFEANRHIIEAKARQIIEGGAQGDVLLRTAMF